MTVSEFTLGEKNFRIDTISVFGEEKYFVVIDLEEITGWLILQVANSDFQEESIDENVANLVNHIFYDSKESLDSASVLQSFAIYHAIELLNRIENLKYQNQL